VAAPSEIGKKIAREPFVKLSIHRIFKAILSLIVFAETITVFNFNVSPLAIDTLSLYLYEVDFGFKIADNLIDLC
jgi:hypothetical protein